MPGNWEKTKKERKKTKEERKRRTQYSNYSISGHARESNGNPFTEYCTLSWNGNPFNGQWTLSWTFSFNNAIVVLYKTGIQILSSGIKCLFYVINRKKRKKERKKENN